MTLPVLLFFEVGGGEILLIMVVVLMFFGSKNIPQIARGLGKGLREIKDASNSIKQEIVKEAEKIKDESGVSKEIQDIKTDINKTLDQ